MSKLQGQPSGLAGADPDGSVGKPEVRPHHRKPEAYATNG